jgi:hypothetical protein
MHGTAQVKHIPEFSVVRLPDGRIGSLEHKTTAKKPWVKVSNETAVVVKTTDCLEVVKYPAELAGEYVQAHQAEQVTVELSVNAGMEWGDIWEYGDKARTWTYTRGETAFQQITEASHERVGRLLESRRCFGLMKHYTETSQSYRAKYVRQKESNS